MPALTEMDSPTLCHWMERFVLEIRKTNGEEYQPNTLYHIVCGIMRYVRMNLKAGVDFFKDAEFAELRTVIDAEMKRLQAKGLGSHHKQAEPLTVEEEDLLWEKKILGDHNPQTLLNTMIYMNGLYFALRSGDEHRNLRHSPCQIEIFERPGERAYLKYTEDFSKNRPGGIKGRKVKPKVVLHHENTENPDRCFVRLFKRYISLCPPDCPPGAFYLTPLKKPRETCWYKTTPIGKNKLSKAVSSMCKACEIQGYKTNHSLRTTAATRLYSSGMDEQLVMERTGHRSVEGIRSYKRTTSDQQENVSDILNNQKKACTGVTSFPELSTRALVPSELAVSSSNTTAISLPDFVTSKAGEFTFNSCTSISINFNNYTETH